MPKLLVCAVRRANRLDARFARVGTRSTRGQRWGAARDAHLRRVHDPADGLARHDLDTPIAMDEDLLEPLLQEPPAGLSADVVPCSTDFPGEL